MLFDPEGCSCLYCCVLACFVFAALGGGYGLIQKEYGLIQRIVVVCFVCFVYIVVC